MLPEDRDTVFDLFDNLSKIKDNSLGIGLPTIKKIVTNADGRIWIEPSEDQGAKFSFTIKKQASQLSATAPGYDQL